MEKKIAPIFDDIEKFNDDTINLNKEEPNNVLGEEELEKLKEESIYKYYEELEKINFPKFFNNTVLTYFSWQVFWKVGP